MNETLTIPPKTRQPIINTPSASDGRTNDKTSYPASSDDFDKEIAQLRRSGKSIREISTLLKVPKGRIERSIKRTIKAFAKDHGVVLTGQTREEITKKIFSLAPKMVEQIEVLSSSAEKQEVQLKASADLLDRAGFSPIQKQVQLSLIEEMSAPQLLDELRAIRETLTARLDDHSHVAAIQSSSSPVQSESIQSTPNLDQSTSPTSMGSVQSNYGDDSC